MRRPFALGLLLAAVLALTPAAALGDATQSSVFQDDQYLVYSPTGVVVRTLGVLQALGVQVLRVNLQWANVAPDPLSRHMPRGFDATDPGAYPAGNWAPYDRLAYLAPLFGMQVEFNLTAPGPLWAMAAHPPTSRAANHWEPNPGAFLKFVYAVGTRYSGRPYGEPAVSTWSIWNEPNQPGWLAPQSLRVRGRMVPQSPRLYRELADAAYIGLYASGHGADTILIGETAPEGYDTTAGFYTAMTPLPFLRGVYCVDRRLRPLRGSAAKALGCPTKGPRAAFVKSHPALFDATGYAHHPYFFFHAPGYRSPDPNFVPIANLGRLERFLDGALRAYGVHRRLPIYFTEYGYQTRPPDPFQVVTLAQQAAYLNEADYMAWRDPRVRSVAQFLLYDAAPDARYRPSQFKYWDTFQTGLAYANGKPKPSLYAYQIPIWVPQTRVRRGGRVFVWGQVRPADRLDSPQQVAIQWRGQRGQYRTIAHATTAPFTGYLTARVRLPGSGYVKLAWTAPSHVEHSRAVAVSVR
jgi:hypothetical protein